MNTDPTLRRDARASLPRGAQVYVWAVVAAAAAVAAAALPHAWDARASWWATLGVPLLYAAGLAIAERLVVRVPLRNQRFSVGLSEAVVVVGLVFLRRPTVIVATALGILANQWLFEPVLLKRLFNTAQYTLGVAAASGVILALLPHWPGYHMLPGADHVDPDQIVRAAPVVVVGMVAFFFVNHTAVSVAVSLATGRGFGESWTRAAPVAAAHWAANTAYGLVTAELVYQSKPLLVLLAVPLALTFLGNRAWARSRAQGQRMRALYSAGRALSKRLGDVESWQAFVDQVAEVLNCEGAAVFLSRPDDGMLEVISTTDAPERLGVPASPAAWEQAARSYASRLGRPRVALEPMEVEGRVEGYAAAFGPRVDADFTAEDRETLRTLANQAAAALLNEQLYRHTESERAALRDIVGHSTDGIYTVGPDRTVHSWNPAMVALTGYGEEEAIGQKCFNLLRARDGKGVDLCANDCPILVAASSRQKQVREASVLNIDGAARWIRYAHAPIVGGDGDMDTDVVLVHDLTREREADQLKSDFVASVSHELRTPLTPIKGFLITLLRDDRKFAEERRREYYQLMLAQAGRLERLIEDLLEVTRLESGASLVETTPIDARDLVAQVVARTAAQEVGREIRVAAPDHPVYARGDRVRTEQVVGNLLTNALRYSPAHEPVEVRVVPQGREVIVEVRDWGAGIPLDEQARIFERFHRVGSYLTRQTGGAGLGLYLAKRLVEAMGGRIWVSSRVGHGSVFLFALPAEPALAAVAPRGRRAAG